MFESNESEPNTAEGGEDSTGRASPCLRTPARTAVLRGLLDRHGTTAAGEPWGASSRSAASLSISSPSRVGSPPGPNPVSNDRPCDEVRRRGDKHDHPRSPVAADQTLRRRGQNPPSAARRPIRVIPDNRWPARYRARTRAPNKERLGRGRPQLAGAAHAPPTLPTADAPEFQSYFRAPRPRDPGPESAQTIRKQVS